MDAAAKDLSEMAEEATLRAIEAVEQCVFDEALPLREQLREKFIECIREQKQLPKKWIKKARRNIVMLKKLKAETLEENERRIDAESPAHVAQVLRAGGRTRNVVAFERLLERAKHPDGSLIARILQGFGTIGSADKTGNWLENGQLEIPKERFVQFWQAAVILRTQKPAGFDDEHLDEIIHGLEEDVKAGRVREVQEADLVAPPAYLFPKAEATKIRRLVDARPQNEYSNMLEKLKLWGSRQTWETIEAYRCPAGKEDLLSHVPAVQSTKDTYHAMEKRRKVEPPASSGGDARARTRAAKRNWEKCRQRVKHRNDEADRDTDGSVIPEIISDDFRLAYYQFACERPELNAIAGWDNMKVPKSYRYFFAYTLQMGNLLSVPSFCRVGEGVMSVAITLLHLPTLLYIDDAAMFAASREQAVIAKELYHQLCDTLGLLMSHKPDADQSSARTDRIKSLGIQYDWERDENGTANKITISIPAEKLEKAAAALDEVIDQADRNTQTRISQKTIEKAIGISSWVTRAGSWFRTGIEPWRFMYEFTGDEEKFRRLAADKGMRSKLWKAAGAAKDFVKNTKPTIIERGGQATRTAALWTDASTDGGADGGPCIGGVIILPDGESRAFSRELTKEECNEMGLGDEPRIETLELLASAVAAAIWGNLLSKTIIWANVDNVIQLYALVKLQGKRAITCNLALATSKILNEAQARAFWRYERSAWNVADWTTRADYFGLVRDILAAELDTTEHIDLKSLTKGQPTGLQHD